MEHMQSWIGYFSPSCLFPSLFADLRMFFFAVWGISLLYNIVDIFMSLYLLKSMRMRYEDPYLVWMGVRILIIVTTAVFIIVQLATGFSFLSQFLAILYIIYRCIGFAIIFRRLRIMRDGLEQEITP
ncbi:unnamed protein product [Orchesella dallaii]|uniref:Uncharacterized protein n=1 Tax=Orchesella dallaii TaxID=48710 RepID=A0ABP1QEI1_9HEXA